ncbi:hypothetical protein Bcep1808_3755 [Burkholderia vietnamiensis G4]|uniref:Uncharacterized protein n=1 Tax=Burkholderia vietnamiensis (strain G4 / LMG 22486) TaxID=269482 RepID=A4JKD5_BURVG|nr:hypothetical protein Bcep1808_3755 [Burkholderia vietnamiensis G4]
MRDRPLRTGGGLPVFVSPRPGAAAGVSAAAASIASIVDGSSAIHRHFSVSTALHALHVPSRSARMFVRPATPTQAVRSFAIASDSVRAHPADSGEQHGTTHPRHV